MSFGYQPERWFWLVGDGEAVWSSAILRFVVSTDPTYSEWKSGGGAPTRIRNESELHGVMLTYVQPIRMMRGVGLKCSSSPNVNGWYAVDDASILRMTALAVDLEASKSETATVPLIDTTGAVHEFSSAHLKAFMSVASGFRQKWHDALSKNINHVDTAYPASELEID